MFDSLRDKFHNFQENLTTTLKGLSSNSDQINRRQVINETIPVNLNAGTDILDKFQTAWSELHEVSQQNATKAELVDGLICKLHNKIDKKWRDVGQLANLLSSLPEVVHNVEELSKKILNLELLFDAVEMALNQLEDIMDTKDFQNRQLEQRFQLALYEEKKLAALESVRLKLADNLAEKVRLHEIKQQKILRECQIAYEEKFKEDLRVYKETKTVPRIEFAKPKGKNSKESSALEEINLDTDPNALNEFLNDTNNEMTSVNLENENNVLENSVSKCENSNSEIDSSKDSKDSKIQS